MATTEISQAKIIFSLAKSSEVLILSIPYENTIDTCNRIAKEVSNNCVIVSPIVPMTRTDSGSFYVPLERRPAFEKQWLTFWHPGLGSFLHFIQR